MTAARARAGTRARALRRARAAQAPAEARRQVRQLRVQAALTAYYQAADQAGRIRRAASARAARIMAEAETAAAVHDAEAARAVAELRGLGEVNAEIARMCGISVPVVRKLVAAGKAGSAAAEPGYAGDGSVPGVPGAGPGP